MYAHGIGNGFLGLSRSRMERNGFMVRDSCPAFVCLITVWMWIRLAYRFLYPSRIRSRFSLLACCRLLTPVMLYLGRAILRSSRAWLHSRVSVYYVLPLSPFVLVQLLVCV
ncbi:hypothetical protein C8T65DRAFT_98347 [Cerioporus squamosus]|nr:hypothetical protein C8T65DRAFT_98347 [Cerioporus squamosus]